MQKRDCRAEKQTKLSGQDMVRNIDGFAGHILFIKGYVAFDLHKSEKISKAKSYEVSQNKVSGLFK